MQPDSIIPDYANPQALNRYSYTLGNPVRYNDPTGHYACSEVFETCDGDLKFERLLKTSDVINKTIGRKDSLEAMAKISDKAASIYGNDWDSVLKALGYIFSGDPVYGSLSLKTFHDTESGALLTFGDKGFHPDFRDTNNQVYHLWGYIANSSAPNESAYGTYLVAESIILNYAHEFDPRASGNGGSWEDFILSESGMYIGSQISKGTITPYDLGNTLRQYIGPTTPYEFTSAGRLEYSYLEYFLLPHATP